jgi:hypothetical protein
MALTNVARRDAYKLADGFGMFILVIPTAASLAVEVPVRWKI